MVFAVVTAASVTERWWFPYAWSEAGSLTSTFYYGDATRFVDYALAIAQGRSYDNGIPYHPPGWPLLLAALFRLSGATGSGAIPVQAIKLLTAMLSGLSVGIAAVLAGETSGLGAMLAVGLLGAFNFGHIVEGTVANSEALYSLLMVTAVWASWRWLRADATHRHAWAAAAAAVGGCAMLVRAEFLACAIVVAGLALVRRARWTEIISCATIFGIVLVPTTVWHWRTLSVFNAAHVGRVAGPLAVFAPVTSYGPFNFAMANHEDADGGPNRDHPMLDLCNTETGAQLEAGQIDLACPAMYDLYVNGYAIGARWLARNPGLALVLVERKIANTIGFLAQGYLADDFAASVDGTRRRVDLVDPDRRSLISLHLLLIAAGLVALRSRAIALGVVAAPVVALAASAMLFYGYVRLGVAYLPVVWVLQGAGLGWLLSAITGRRAGRQTVVLALSVMALLVAYDRSTRDAPRPIVVNGPRLPNGALMQDETVDISRQ